MLVLHVFTRATDLKMGMQSEYLNQILIQIFRIIQIIWIYEFGFFDLTTLD